MDVTTINKNQIATHYFNKNKLINYKIILSSKYCLHTRSESHKYSTNLICPIGNGRWAPSNYGMCNFFVRPTYK